MTTLYDHLQAIETIRVAHADVKVVWNGPLLRREGLLGQTDYTKGEITLDPDLNGPKARITMVHEMVHMMDEAFQLGMEEREVTLLANALVMLFRDNPWLKELL